MKNIHSRIISKCEFERCIWFCLFVCFFCCFNHYFYVCVRNKSGWKSQFIIYKKNEFVNSLRKNIGINKYSEKAFKCIHVFRFFGDVKWISPIVMISWGFKIEQIIFLERMFLFLLFDICFLFFVIVMEVTICISTYFQLASVNELEP